MTSAADQEEKSPTALEVAREITQAHGIQVDDAMLDYIIFEHTGFPSFWDIPKDGATPEECLRKQLTEWCELQKKGETP
jgi:hypothetical protein